MSDPTGTAGLRRAFLAEANRRLMALRSQTHKILVEHDLMAAKNDPLAELMPNPGHRLQAFMEWFERTANALFTGEDWWSRFLQRAQESGSVAGSTLLGHRPLGPVPVPAVYGEMMAREIAGITAAMMQQVSRVTGAAALSQHKPARMYRAVLGAVRKVGYSRMETAVNTVTVQLHNAGRLAQFRAAGVGQVGINPERIEPPRPSRFGRRLRHDHQHDHFVRDDAASDLAAAEDAVAEAQDRVDEAKANVAELELIESQALAKVEVTAARVDTEMNEVAQVEDEVSAAEVRADEIRNDPGSSASQIAYGELMLSRAQDKLARAQARLDAAVAAADDANTASEQATADADAARSNLAEADSALQESMAALQEAQLAAQEGDQVNVQTAGDDRVCARCQALADAGPYSIDEAQGLLPLHPRCRCSWVPA